MLDKTDKTILKELKNNSRISLKDMSKKTNIRPSTIHSRIQKLVKDNVIENFTITTNDSKLNEEFIVFVLVNADKEIKNTFFNKREIKDVFGVTGSYDLIMKCKFSDINEFNKFILELRKLPEVQNTLTMVSTIKIKEKV